MNSTTVVFLGIIAFCAVVQALFFAVAAYASVKAASRLDSLALKAQGDLARIGRQVEDATARLESLSVKARETVARTEPLVADMAARAERASGAVRRSIELPFVPVRNGSALLHGVLRAFEVYRDGRPPATSAR
jgi:hypothetical protein